MSGGEMFSGLKFAIEVVMVSEYVKQVDSTLQLVTLFLQHQLHAQQLLVADVIVPLHRGQLPRKECTWMQLPNSLLVLREHSAHHYLGGIYFYDERQWGIWLLQDWRRAKKVFEVLEGASSFQLRAARWLGSRAVREAATVIEPTEKTVIENGKPQKNVPPSPSLLPCSHPWGKSCISEIWS